MIKLLIVDDSALMRRQLTLLFEAHGGFVIRQARTGLEAVEENRQFQPDVITLDINMPEMDGITALSLIMAERPVPVVMVSSLTEQGALATFEALNLGAVDYVAKPGGTISMSLEHVAVDLLNKVRAATQAQLRPLPSRPAQPPRSPTARRPAAASARPGQEAALLIGVSTGGPSALETLLPALPAEFPWPVLVAQHMPGSFTGPFAARLDARCALQVQEVNRPLPMLPGNVYIARGGGDMVLSRRGQTLTVLPRPESHSHLWHPSVEVLARSALEHLAPSRLSAVMLTGMGHDGADGFAEIKRRGGRTIAESKDTAVVFGMPGELVARGGASLVLPLHRIAQQLATWAHQRAGAPA